MNATNKKETVWLYSNYIITHWSFQNSQYQDMGASHYQISDGSNVKLPNCTHKSWLPPWHYFRCNTTMKRLCSILLRRTVGLDPQYSSIINILFVSYVPYNISRSSQLLSICIWNLEPYETKMLHQFTVSRWAAISSIVTCLFAITMSQACSILSAVVDVDGQPDQSSLILVWPFLNFSIQL